MQTSNKEISKLLLIRPPYHLWPIINESDNFLMPLGLPSLSAYLKQSIEGLSVKIIDCLPLKIGYSSLKKILIEEKPDIVGVGDSLPYIYEGLKTLKIAKELFPDVITVAGGHFHSPMASYTLNNYPHVDYIIKYEGEKYLAELVSSLMRRKDISNIPSLAYRAGDKIIENEPGGLIQNLDDLPMPDYEAMPMDKYAPFGKLWPKSMTIQGSRGCPMECDYCSWSAQEGEHKNLDGKIVLVPKIRYKSVDKVLDEIDVLYKKYNTRYLFWVDGTWNFNTDWVDKLCSEILKRNYKLNWWAFVRADLLIEQEKSGVLDKMVKAGLKHTLFGGERFSESEMNEIGKKGLKGMEVKEACRILKIKYPSVFRQATFVTGIRSETKESILKLGAYSREANLDFAAFHPLMPYPGTPLWEKANRENWIEEYDFSKYDMFYPVMPSETLSRTDIAKYTQMLYKYFVIKRPIEYIKGLFSTVEIRRKLQWWFLISVMRVIFRDLKSSIKNKKAFEGFAAINKLWRPKWYDK